MRIRTIFRTLLLGGVCTLAGCGVTPDRSYARGDSPKFVTGSRQSIRAWIPCSGVTDDTAGFAKALAAARHNTFTLVVDCPVTLKIGSDISRSVFIDDGTTVEFTEAGKITVDNVFIPAFVIADSSHITLANWNVEYNASLPMNMDPGGYLSDGARVTGPKPGNAFNDIRISRWLAANRGIVFDKKMGNVNSQWTGTTNACAVFFITGDSSALRFTGMHMHVPEGAGGERFIPVAIALGVNFRPNQTVTARTPLTSQYFAVPHDVTFSDVEMDGTYMGWVGGVQDAVFENIRSKRYGDLQDASGGTVGGVKKWFAPPHLIYLSYSTNGDPGLFNSGIQVRHVIDSGLRVGKARDAGGTDTISGYALSIKLGCVHCSVNDYQSSRPDGFMDVLTSDGLTVSNVTATFDSSFLNNLFPGWRFPSATYKNVRFENVSLVDTAKTTMEMPLGNANQASNGSIVMKNVRIEMNEWKGPRESPLPIMSGQTLDISLDYLMKNAGTRLVSSRTGDLETTLQGTPSTLQPGASTSLTWTSKNADHCVAGGAWSESIGTSGSRTLSIRQAGSHDVVLTCARGGDTTSVRLPIVLSP